MNYEETLKFLYSSLPMFQRKGAPAYKATLDNTRALDDYFGHPHKKFRSVHIAGTNGKGSVAHMLSAILQSDGYKTGLYTSPHLKDFRERIRINGQPIPEDEVISFVSSHMAMIDKVQPTFFEMTVAMAFDYFAREKVDLAVIETGMGGRLDSTNIITPLVSLITNIGLDHTQFLGPDKEIIAAEKAGIIKERIPVIIGETQKDISKVFIDRSAELNAPIYFADQEYIIGYSMRTIDDKQSCNVYRDDEVYYQSLETDLLGLYQRHNIVSCLKVLDVLKSQDITISDEAIYQGLADVGNLTGLRGRWEIMDYNPLVVCDAAHNSDGLEEVMGQIQQTPYKNLHMVVGIVKDKNPEEILAVLPEHAEYYFTQASIPRALDRFKLADIAKKMGLSGNIFETPSQALRAAKLAASADDLIFVGGSTFIVAEVLT